MRKYLIGTALAVGLASAPASAAMNAEAFYQSAHRLMAKGPLALFSSDYKRLKAEGTAAGEAARRARMAALRNGRQPRYCPPGDVRGMASMEFLERLGKIPAAERRSIDMVEATNRLLAAKYPCKG